MPFKIVTIGFKQADLLLGELKQVMFGVNKTDIVAMGKIALDDVREHFDKSGRPDENWPRFKQSTLRRIAFNTKAARPIRRIGFTGHKLLMNTKETRNSNKVITVPNGFFIKNSKASAVYHLQGTSVMAQRNFFYFSNKAVSKMIAVPLNRLKRASRRRV